MVAVMISDTVREGLKSGLLLFLITASHGVLDAMTNGGLGVAFFSPFDPTRYFFSWRPIAVSPIGAGRFLSARGMYVLWTELVWLWGPILLLAGGIWAWRRAGTRVRTTSE
jgi:inner membrane protein